MIVKIHLVSKTIWIRKGFTNFEYLMLRDLLKERSNSCRFIYTMCKFILLLKFIEKFPKDEKEKVFTLNDMFTIFQIIFIEG